MKEGFFSQPNLFVSRLILDFTAKSTLNRLEEFNGDPIFEEPLVGFARGDDPLFELFRSVVHPEHLLPMGVMSQVLGREPEAVTVVSFVLPVHEETRKANAREKIGPARRWNHTRWLGQSFIDELSLYVVSVFEGMGIPALAPEQSPFFSISSGPFGISSVWSQRHIAYAAGLGTFGLSDALITEKGSAVRCGSVIIAHGMEPSARPYTGHHDYCLFFRTGKCGLCMKRCPREAITPQGHDKMRCYEILTVDQRPWLEGAYGTGYIGKYAGCGLCLTGVPCEDRIPTS